MNWTGTQVSSSGATFLNGGRNAKNDIAIKGSNVLSDNVKEGRLRGWLSNLLFCGGLGEMGAAILLLSGWKLYVALVAGLVAVSISSFEAKARVLGLKPFTNDPLDWRKAKESYKTEA